MKRLLCFLFLVSSIALGQSTTVTATITDSDSQTWNNGTVVATFVPNPTTPLSQYVWTGGALAAVTGTMNGSGAFSISVPSLANITPSNGKWNISICPNASGACQSLNTTLVTGASVSLTSQLSAIAIGPRFPAGPNSYGYTDTEVLTPSTKGAVYYNVTTPAQRIWSGSAWSTNGGSGSGTVSSGTGKCLAWYATTGTTVGADCDIDDGSTLVNTVTVTNSNGLQTSMGNITSGSFLVTLANIVQFNQFTYLYSNGNGLLRLSDIGVDDGVGLFETPALGQQNANDYGGKCSMATTTSCTITISHTFTTPVCIATQQSGTLTGVSVGCTVSGTTVTVTATTNNTETWGAFVFGDPN